MEINQKTLRLIKEHEGLRLRSYKDPVGVWTIGYGTTSRAGIGVRVTPDMVITEDVAEEYLQAALEKFSVKITPAFQRKPTPNQYGAMMSLAYNIGPEAFLKSTALKRFNAGDFEGAADAMTWFNKADGKVLRGLVRRREDEAELFLSQNGVRPMPRPDDLRTSPLQSTENIAHGIQLTTGISTVIGSISELSGTAQIALVIAGALIAGLAIYGMFRRTGRWRG